jgi:hypothetical protein
LPFLFCSVWQVLAFDVFDIGVWGGFHRLARASTPAIKINNLLFVVQR